MLQVVWFAWFVGFASPADGVALIVMPDPGIVGPTAPVYG